jgi:hypothetical protein
MSMSDPISDMLTRVRNSLMRQHPSVSMPYSKMKEAVALVLKDEGYIVDFQVLSQKPRDVLQIELKYVGGRRDGACFQTGAASLCWFEECSLGIERDGYFNPDHIPWNYDRSAGSSQGYWRRSYLQDLVMEINHVTCW